MAQGAMLTAKAAMQPVLLLLLLHAANHRPPKAGAHKLPTAHHPKSLLMGAAHSAA